MSFSPFLTTASELRPTCFRFPSLSAFVEAWLFASTMLSTRKPNAAYIDWHPGEQSVQATMNLSARVPIEAIVDKLPEQHRIFHSTTLRFLPVTTLDEQGRPWASVLCSKDGSPSFISSPSATSMEIKAHTWEGDPIVRNVQRFETLLKDDKRPLISAIGLETSTRRRNKFGGSIVQACLRDRTLFLGVSVNSALGYTSWHLSP